MSGDVVLDEGLSAQVLDLEAIALRRRGRQQGLRAATVFRAVLERAAT